MRTQNKGEWSEYTTKMDIMVNKSIRVINIDTKATRHLEVHSLQTHNKEYRMLGNSIYETIYPQSTSSNEDDIKHRFVAFGSEVKPKLKQINQQVLKGKGSFSIPDAEQLANSLGIETSCDYSHHKGDLIIGFINEKGHRLPPQRFSLKSFIGKNPTILNSSQHSTRIQIQIEGVDEHKLIALKNKKYKARENMKELMTLNANLKTAQFSETMESNMNQLNVKESLLYAVILHFTKGFKEASKMNELEKRLETVEEKNKFNLAIKRLLRASLTGMNPAEYWDGIAKMSDNFLLKRSDGSCDAFVGKNTVESYLYDFCYMDTPSQSRHDYGYLYHKEGKWFIDLNFQIRLSKIALDESYQK